MLKLKLLICCEKNMEENQSSEFKNFLKTVGKNVRELRKDRKMTQSQLAITARVDLNTICNIENGKFPTNLDTIYKLAKAFKVRPFILLQTEGLYYKNIKNIRGYLVDINKELNKLL